MERTQINALLDDPIEKGKNALWCSIFISAWKGLQRDIAGEPIVMAEEDALVARLNYEADPQPDLPEGAFYSQAGLGAERIVERVYADMQRLFPLTIR